MAYCYLCVIWPAERKILVEENIGHSVKMPFPHGIDLFLCQRELL
jgi:hypothetical protein